MGQGPAPGPSMGETAKEGLEIKSCVSVYVHLCGVMASHVAMLHLELQGCAVRASYFRRECLFSIV